MKLRIVFILGIVGCTFADSDVFNFDQDDVAEFTTAGDENPDKEPIINQKVDEKPTDEVKLDENVNVEPEAVEPKPMNMEWAAAYGNYPYDLYFSYDPERRVMYPITYPYLYRSINVKAYNPESFYNVHGYYPAY